MADDDAAPHFAAPFNFGANGDVDVVDQDSPAEIAACVYNVVVCPVGLRIDQPDFGVDDVLFGQQPLDVSGMIEQAEEWEPRADIVFDYQDQFERMLNAQTGGRQAARGESDIALVVTPDSSDTSSETAEIFSTRTATPAVQRSNFEADGFISVFGYRALSVTNFPSRVYMATAADTTIAITETAGAWTIFLSPAAGLQPGYRIRVQDESGGAGTNNITITAQGSDLIDGNAAAVIQTNFGYLDLSVKSDHNGYYALLQGGGGPAPPQPPGPGTPPVIT